MHRLTGLNLTIASLVCLMSNGCALPKGMVSDSQRTDADGGARDAGPRHLDASTASKGAAAGSGTGGAGGKAGDAAVVRTPDAALPMTEVKPKPKANGEVCDSSAQCMSANCKKGPKGDKHCYGSVGRGRDCNDAYECDGYACVPRKHGETQGVCIDTSACAQDACRSNQALAYCQLDQKCSATPLDFVRCYEDRCAGDSDEDAGCAGETAFQHLNEIGCCPAGGVATGSTCGTSPQCGCADDQKCDSVRDGSHAICGPRGYVADGEMCLKEVDCLQGFSCRGRMCKRYCDGPDDDSCPNGACVPGITNDKPDPGIFVCTRTCDPTSPATHSDKYVGCGPNQACSPSSDGNSDCYFVTGTAMQGDSCADDKGEASGFLCAPGYACMIGENKCDKLCKVADGVCEFGVCYSFGSNKSYAGNVEIGYCE